MKKLSVYLASLLSAFLILSCSSSIPEPNPDTETPKVHLAEQDSIALAEIWKKGGGEYWDVKWDLNDIYTWGGVSAVLSDPETLEYRVVSLLINCSETNVVCKIPEEVGDLTELRGLYIWGLAFGGKIPQSITKLKHLSEMSIRYTNIYDTIPEGIFSLPNLDYMEISWSKMTGELPKDIKDTKAYKISLNNNYLSGEIPTGIKSNVNLRCNEFTEYPFDYCTNDYYKTHREHFIDVQSNYITGTIPEYILQDSIALDILCSCTRVQNEGYGYTNTPDDW